MNKFKTSVFTFLTIMFLGLIFLSSCSSQDRSQPPGKTIEEQVAPSKPVICKKPRPQICMQVYIPVCATRDTDIQCVTTPCPSTKKVTYSNACTACADSLVISYTAKACFK